MQRQVHRQDAEDSYVDAVPGAAELVQVHLRLRRTDAEILKKLASDQDRTLSAVVRHILRAYRHNPEAPGSNIAR